jgi:hypothetical protein
LMRVEPQAGKVSVTSNGAGWGPSPVTVRLL